MKSFTTRRLARNSAWNLGGTLLPALVAIVTIPPMIHRLGVDRFGLLTLIFVVVGYFSVFDMGLGRAMTQMVARHLGTGEHGQIPGTFWTALGLMAATGLGGALVVYGLCPLLVQNVFDVPLELRAQAQRAFYIVATALPIVVSAAGVLGVIEAHQAFRASATIRAVRGTITYLGPLVTTIWTIDLGTIALVLLTGRMLEWVGGLLVCCHLVPNLHRQIRFERSRLKPLLSFGGWMTVSNVISPLMLYLDRFLLVGILSVAAVAYYVTPAEMVVKSLILPNAIVGVLFPVFAATYLTDPASTGQFFGNGLRYVFSLMLPLALLVVGTSNLLLNLWLGTEFVRESTAVLQVLMIGLFLNAVAHMPAALVQGMNRPDLTAKLHLCELPLYTVAVVVLTWSFGIVGTALAWAGRAAFDMVLLLFLSGRVLPAARVFSRQTLWSALFATMLLALIALVPSQWMQLSLTGVCQFVVVAGIWHFVLTSNERAGMRGLLTRLPAFIGNRIPSDRIQRSGLIIRK